MAAVSMGVGMGLGVRLRRLGRRHWSRRGRHRFRMHVGTQVGMVVEEHPFGGEVPMPGASHLRERAGEGQQQTEGGEARDGPRAREIPRSARIPGLSGRAEKGQTGPRPPFARPWFRAGFRGPHEPPPWYSRVAEHE
ncbi:MAG: hypothetical protein MI919_37215 [Holophagales bacterium]|nr:hypothetical protein [Holophagales bacterium]